VFIATVIVSGFVALLMTVSGYGKLVRQPTQMKTMNKVRFPEDRLWLLATAEFAGAAGLVAGLFWWPIGVAAAIGAVLYFVGALISHLRVRDTEITPALSLALVSGAAIALRLLSR
jgi:hypothetical protein